MRSRIAVLLVLAGAPFLVLTAPAGAQETDEDRPVEITFEVGDFDGDRGDWPITEVHVTGDMDDGVPFTVELRGTDDTVLWAGTEPFTAPTTSFAVVAFVGVGEVVEAGVSQTIPDVAGEQVEREVEILRQGAGGGGSGLLALSMVLAVILVAILFRSPLPSATTQRWTK